MGQPCNSRVAIVGAGPAGAALACFLRLRGIRVYLFADNPANKLVVGESLVSAAVPILRRLGIEDDVAAISHIKLGAGLRHSDGTRVDFRFPHYSERRPGYAYNIPRPDFDRLLLNRAQALGAQVIYQKAQVEPAASDRRDIQLTETSLAAMGLTRNQQPDWLVDASGRARIFSRCLQLPVRKGQRRDIAHFAHFTNFDADSAFDGQVLLTAADHGWFWQIPQRHGLSVGVVMDKHALQRFGENPQQQLNNAIDWHPLLSRAGQHRQATSEVVSYARYQLMSQRAYGKGWALVGDAYGFVDPMLSPGVFMAMQSAQLLDQTLFANPGQEARQLAAYANELYGWHDAWQNLIEYFYNGQLLTLASVKQSIASDNTVWHPRNIMEKIVSNALAGMTTGYKTRSKLSGSILRHSCDFISRDPELQASRAITCVVAGNS